MKNICPWCPAGDPLYLAYHNEEWGVPVSDGRLLFEMLNLEGAQAGLSWRTVLHKRENYRRIFDGFDPGKLSRWNDKRVEKALLDPGIIRNRLKVGGVVRNARAVMDHFDGDLKSFSDFLWGFSQGKPAQPNRRSMGEIPAKTETSDLMSKELRLRNFTFVGSTICYAFMQAVGMINDHLVTCPRHSKCRALAKKSKA